MIVKLLTEHHLEFLSFKGGSRGSSESTHIKMPHCTKSHAKAKITVQKYFVEGNFEYSIHDASVSVFKDIIASPKMEKKSVLHEA